MSLRDGAAWLDLSERGKIRVTGEDRARLLHAMSTNHIQQLTPGQGCYAFFLSAQGRILADANVLCRAEEFLLDTEGETREKLYSHLDKYIIADDVTLEDITDSIATIAVEGPRAAETLRAIGAPAPEAPYANAEWGAGLAAAVSYTGRPGYFLFVPAAQKSETIRQLEEAGAVSGTVAEFEAARIENGRARYGADLSERYLAQEANQPRALHFNKGCYLGQEIVERVRSRGQVHRVLGRIALDTAESPQPGTKLQAGGKDVAQVTSAAISPASGKAVALAYIRVEHAKAGTELQLAGVGSGVVLP